MATPILGKLKRLPEMPPAEIRYRLLEAVRKGVEGAVLALGQGEPSDAAFVARLPVDGDAPSPVGDYLRAALGERFYLSGETESRRGLYASFDESFPGARERLVAEAERLCQHRVQLLGIGEVPLGAEIDWHRDPVSGRSWERRPWPSYDLVHEVAPGDPKRVLELSRHQHLPRLGIAYALSGDPRYAREVVAQLRGWIEQNPVGIGVHWHSSLELAIRALSWLWALWFVLPSDELDEATARAVAKSLFAQLDHVHNYPSIFSTPNTHLIGEAAALVVGGLVFADSDRGARWLERGGELLEQQLVRQFGRDGLHAELSCWYHCYAVEFYLLALALAERDAHPLARTLRPAVEHLLEPLLELVRPDGSLPMLGDDDGGRALALSASDYGDVRDLLSTGAVLFGRGDLRQAAAELAAETFWLAGADAGRRFRTLVAPGNAAHRASLVNAGYFVLRSGRRVEDCHLTFDCGDLGRLGGGHGHADALAVTLWAHGRELLVDPGTCVYNGDRIWRDWFRSTRAHNTVVVDGRDQSEPADTFRWKRAATSRLLGAASFEGIDYLAGEHDGFAGDPPGVTHRRRVLYVRDDYFLVVDELLGSGKHTVELFHHLPPEAEVGSIDQLLEGREARLSAAVGGAGLLLSMHSTSPLDVRVARGESEPRQGWVSRRYGERQAAPAVVVRVEAELPLSIATLLTPFSLASAERLPLPDQQSFSLPIWNLGAGKGRSGSGGALAIAIGGGEDAESGGCYDLMLCSPERTELRAARCRARGELFWARIEGGELARLFGARAESFSFRGRDRLERPIALFHRRFDTDFEGASLAHALVEEPSHVRYRGTV